LQEHTDDQILDFYHATEYLADVANHLFMTGIERRAWLDDRCHELKHTPRAANTILAEMEYFAKNLIMKEPIAWALSQSNKNVKGIISNQLLEKAKAKSREQAQDDSVKTRKERLASLSSAITYFKNNINHSRMDYAEHVIAHHPIGSGVTEAACKTIVKQRLCQSGMRWKDKGAKAILSLRTLIKSTGRWEQFWQNQWGFPVAY
jgi:hypothetical protein